MSKLVEAMGIADTIARSHDIAVAMLEDGLMPRDVSYWGKLSEETIEEVVKIKKLIKEHINDEYDASTKQWREVGEALLERLTEPEP